MKIMVLFLLSLSLFSVAQAKNNLAYQTEDYRSLMKILGQNLVIEEALAKIALRKFDIYGFSALMKLSRKLGLDPQKHRLLVEAHQNQISIPGLQKPLIISNSPDFQLTYLGDPIKFSSKMSLEDNLQNITKFFEAHGVRVKTKSAKNFLRFHF
jgi:hypothetical protein